MGIADTGAAYHAFSWTQAGGMVDLGALLPGELSSEANAVSNGQVVGDAFTLGFLYEHAFSWTQAGGMIDLGTLGGIKSHAEAVSNGQVVGIADTAGGYHHAFSWTQAGGMVDLGGSYSEARAVSNGQVVGLADNARGYSHAFSWTQAGGMVDLGTLGGSYSYAWVVSNGQVVGDADTASGAMHAFSTQLVTLVDPVPQLVGYPMHPTTLVDQTTVTDGTVVSGVAADGVTEIVLRIPASFVGQQLKVTLSNDQTPPQQSLSASDDGALGKPGDTFFSASQLTVAAESTSAGPMAFAVYRAPVDFPRAGGQDASSAWRFVSVQVTDVVSSAVTGSAVITILRPPVILVHGLWGSYKDWDRFQPFIGDSRFVVNRADYSDRIGYKVRSFSPGDPSPSMNTTLGDMVILKARSNAVGFSYNAPKVFDQIVGNVESFKTGRNPAGIKVAAIQADIVAHSMGGDISRYLPLLLHFGTTTNFAQGPVHKVITIDTPHKGSPLAFDLLEDSNRCVRNLFTITGKPVFYNVTTWFSGTSDGAIYDIAENPNDGTLSPALQQIHQASTPPLPSTPRLPTALIAAIMDPLQLDKIDSPPNKTAFIKAF